MEAAVATTCVSFLLINVSTAVSQAIWLMRTKKLQWRERQTTKQPFKPSFNVIIQNCISMTVLPALSPPSLPIFFSSMHLTFSLYLSTLILRFTTCINAGKPKAKLEDEPISMPQVPSTRWSPTPEQLMILEEMYRSGVRTPNASQIQQITAHLSFYGKIEGKNVFYWFQNHKARERQKLRRRLGRQQQQQQQQQQQPCPQHLPHLNNLDNASLTSSPLYPHSLPPFYHQGGIPDETEGLDLLGKLETGGRRGEASSSGTSSRCRCEWMAMLEPCSEDPPMTLELFPTQSTGLRDDCSTSKSSSCSASTN